jgi:mono/diheme cytochrome c family protein
MRKLQVFFTIFGTVLIALSMGVLAAVAQDTSPTMTQEELIARGEYVAHIAGCISCHSPYKEEFADFSQLSPEQLQTVGLFALQALDLENRAFAGGRPFDLGPLGMLWTPNITSDEETGIGSWTDEEIEVAIRIGVTPSERRLFPVMPYRNYFTMADSDMKALIAFLRNLPPVSHNVDRSGPSGEGFAPELVLDGEVPQTPPDGSDPVALGAYLVNTVMSCADCHTPLDPNTGMPIMDMWLAGGQAYEGPWGIVYGGNITPHETGIGDWTAEDIERSMRQGLNTENRRLILMPWEDYAVATEEDMAAVIAYLQSLPAVANIIPEPSIDEIFIQYAEN